MKDFKYFIRNYKYDIIASLVSVASLLIAYHLDRISTFLISVFIVFGSLIWVVYQKAKDRDFYFISFDKRENKDDWIGRGKFEYYRPQRCFVITDSESGYIFSKCLSWSDYKMSFNFKIVNSCLGVVLRAVNLSNYIMLQIREYGIRPHIRINGGWKPWEAEESNLKFSENLSLDKWYKCVVICEKDTLDIRVYENDTRVLFSRQWIIPTGMMGFDFREDPQSRSVTIPFPINLEYGSMGFRNSGAERAIFKNFLVEKL